MFKVEAHPGWPVVAIPAAAGRVEREAPPESDYVLAQKSARGDTRAFEEIFLRHNRRVYSLCLRMTRNASEAEDLTQEIFIHLFHKIGSFEGRSAFTTWLHTMAVNQTLMHFRKSRVRRELTTHEGEAPARVVPGTEDPRSMPVVDRIALEKAVAELSPGYRMAFILHDVEGYEHEEIARMLGCAVGTSKSQLHKARRRRELMMGKSVNELYELFDKLYDLKARAVLEKEVAARKKLKNQVINGVNDFLPVVNNFSPGTSSESGERIAGEELAELKKIRRKAEELRDWAFRNL